MNTIEYGGHFHRDQYVEISYVRAKHMVICRVKDTGEGFTLDQIEQGAKLAPIRYSKFGVGSDLDCGDEITAFTPPVPRLGTSLSLLEA